MVDDKYLTQPSIEQSERRRERKNQEREGKRYDTEERQITKLPTTDLILNTQCVWKIKQDGDIGRPLAIETNQLVGEEENTTGSLDTGVPLLHSVNKTKKTVQ